MAAEDDDLSALLSEPTGAYDESTLELFDEASAVLSESVEAAADRTDPSPEELAWADSCLDIGSELSDDKWIAMRDAFLEALSSFPLSYETSSSATRANQIVEEREGSDAENDSCSEDTRAMLIHPEQHSSDDESQRETQRIEGPSLENNSSGLQEDIDSPETIFKVWDLEIPEPDDEEDELILQLKKLMAGRSQEVLLPPPDNLGTAGSQENVEELVTSMGDLSLKHFD